MYISVVYNKTMEVEKFIAWINAKFLEWRGDSRLGVSDFARYLNIKQQTMSLWLNGNIKSLPSAEHLSRIASIYPEVMEVVGLQPLDYLPNGIRGQWSRAVAEIRSTFREKGITEGSDEADKIALEIFEKFGFNLTSME